MNKKLLFALRTALNFALITALASGLIVLAHIFMGLRPVAVTSISMSPAILKDDLIFVERFNSAKLAEGRVITFRQPDTNALVTHRVTEIDAEAGTVMTRGDAGDSDDGPVPFENIVGIYVYRIPSLGKYFY